MTACGCPDCRHADGIEAFDEHYGYDGPTDDEAASDYDYMTDFRFVSPDQLRLFA